MKKWNLSDIYYDYEDLKREYNALVIKVSKLEERLYEDKLEETRINEKLEDVTSIYETLNKIYYYTLLQHNNDLNSEAFKQQLSQSSILYSRVDKYVDCLQEKIDAVCDELEEKEDSEEKQLISELRHNLFIKDMFDEVVYKDSYINEFSYNGEKYIINSFTHIPLLCDSSPDIRRLTYMYALKKYEGMKDIISFVINTYYKLWEVEASSQQENNGFEYLLNQQGMLEDYRIIKKILNEKMYIHHKLIQQKKRLLGLESISFYDMYPIGVEYNEIFDIESAKEIILKALEVLGEEYSAIVTKVFDENWIDWEAREGKSSEVYSVCVYGIHSYIALNWDGTLESLYNLVHELGGAIASYMGMQEQSIFEFEPSRFLNEVAAFVNEKLLTHYLLNTVSNNKFKKVILLKSLDRMRENLFKCLESAEMEESLSKIVEERRLTSECISEAYMKIMRKYYSTDGFEIIEENRCNWVKNGLLISEGYTVEYIKSEIFAEEIFNLIKEKKITYESYVNAYKFGSSKSDEKIMEFIGCETDINILLNRQMDTMEELIEKINQIKLNKKNLVEVEGE